MHSLDSLDPVFKDDCAYCNKFVKSGKCKILLSKNEKAFEKERKKREKKKEAESSKGVDQIF